MKRLEKFFLNAVMLSGRKYLMFYIKVLIGHFLWSITVCAILHMLGISFSQHIAKTEAEATNNMALIGGIVLIEETMFRWFPMMGLQIIVLIEEAMSKQFQILRLKMVIQKNKKKIIFVIVILSSIIFGYFHGNVYNILLQGVGGIIMYFFYLRRYYRDKIIKRNDNWNWQLRPLLASSIYHYISNLVLIMI